MIARYSRKEMSELWSDQSRLQIWLEVELAALDAFVDEGILPKTLAEEVRAKAQFQVERTLKIEEEVKHDVIAFLTNVAEHGGPGSRFLHRGMTSSDLLDTAFAIQLTRAADMLLAGIDKALAAIKTRAIEHRITPCVGRSHGIHAEPTSFGVKLSGWYAELSRGRRRLRQARHEIAVGKIAGAVGTYASVSPVVEGKVLSRFGLRAEAVPTQVVARDHHAAFFQALALIATSIERFATEIRHLQRTEVREVEEKFTVGQKGSSAMPHKRNPILSENLCGLARLVRSYGEASLENVALWHERDIGHSSVERVAAPDATILLDFMLARFTGLVTGMVVYPQRMLENLDLTRGLVFSGSLLIALVDHGIAREVAYKWVQTHALLAWEGGATFKERVMSDPDISKAVAREVIEGAFDIKRHLAHVDLIMERAFSEE